jgi:hypothetical protein
MHAVISGMTGLKNRLQQVGSRSVACSSAGAAVLLLAALLSHVQLR